MKNLFYLFDVKIIFMIILAFFSSAIVPCFYISILNVFVERLRFSFIDRLDFFQSLIPYIISMFLMTLLHFIHMTFASLILKSIYKKIYLFSFKNIYNRVDNLSIKHNEENDIMKQAENIMLIVKMLFLIWIPRFWDLLASTIFLIKINKSLAPLLLILYIFNALCLIMFIKTKRNPSQKIHNHLCQYKAFVHDVLKSRQINLVYKLSNIHYKLAKQYIQNGANYYSKLIIFIFTSEVLISFINLMGLIALLIFQFKYHDQLTKNKNAVLFTMIFGIHISLWIIVRNVMPLLGLFNSIKSSSFIVSPSKQKEKLFIEESKNSIIFEYHNKTIAFLYGLNILRGLPGSGKTTMANYLCRLSSNSIIMPQDDIVYNLSSKENMIGSLEFISDIESKIKTIVLNYDKLMLLSPTTMSGGEKKMLNFLRLVYYIEYAKLVNKSYNIIIFDEPFNHLDEKFITVIKKYILSLNRDEFKICIILIDHNNRCEQNANFIFNLH